MKYSGTENLEVMSSAENYNQFLIGLILKHCPNSRSALDFGAGIGVFAEKLTRIGLDVTCVEPDLDQARTIEALGLKVYSDLVSIPADSCEYIYTLNVLEHIEFDDLVIQGLGRILMRNGTLFIYVPAFEILYSSMDRKVGHFRRYTKSLLQEKVEKAGLIVTEAEYVDSLGFFATLLYRLVGSREGSIGTKSLMVYDKFFFPASRFLDRWIGRFIGKNVMLVCKKPSI